MNKNNFIFSLIMLTILLFAVGSISANENVTDDTVSIGEDTDLSLESIENTEISKQNEAVEQSYENESATSPEILSATNESDSLGAYSGNAYVEDATNIWGANDYVYFGWSGYFSGSFKVYKGTSCVHDETLSGNNRNMQWNTGQLSVGTYTAKLIYYDGSVLDQSKIIIQKSAVKVSCKSFKAKAGTTFYCYAYVTDKYDGANYDGGYVYFKINGKTYKAALNDGVAILKFKIPSKAKTYTCKATYKGNSQFKGATKTFKMTVKKAKKIKYKTLTKSISYKWKTQKIGKYKVHYRLWRVVFYGGYCNYVDIEFYKNGKQVSNSKYLTTYHTKENGRWKWMPWRHGKVNHSYHRYITTNKVDKIKIKFAV